MINIETSGILFAWICLLCLTPGGELGFFLNVVDKASGYQLVAPIRSKRPDEIMRVLSRTWLIPFGFPSATPSDNGGEFDAEFAEQCEGLGSTLVLRGASYAPTQNAVAERAGGAWKASAKAVMDECSLSFSSEANAEYVCAAVNWATNNEINGCWERVAVAVQLAVSARPSRRSVSVM